MDFWYNLAGIATAWADEAGTAAATTGRSTVSRSR